MRDAKKKPSFQIAEKKASSDVYDASISLDHINHTRSQLDIFERIISIPNGQKKDELLLHIHEKLKEYNY